MKYNDLRSLLHYVPRFRGRTFVVMMEGEIIGSHNFPNVLQDLAVLHSLGMKLVIVFGIRHQLREMAAKEGITLSSMDGLGITDEATLELSMDISSRVATDLLQDLTLVGLNGAITNAVTAHPAGVIDGQELQFTGSIDKVDENLLAAIIDKDIIPIVPPLGFEKQGRVLRLNSTAVARQIGMELKAEKILLLVPDSIERDGRRVRQLPVVEAKAMSKAALDRADTGRAYQLRMAVEAVEGGVGRVHFVDARVDEALLGELFSFEGTGTMVYDKPYRHVRPARRADIPGIISMIQKAVEDQELVGRSQSEVKEHLADYYVLEVDNSLVGVVSLHKYLQEKTAELGCLYIRKSHEGLGYGSQLVEFVEDKARELKAETLFALSTQAYFYFEKKFGFKIGGSENLPELRRKKWERSGRNSRILVKNLVKT